MDHSQKKRKTARQRRVWRVRKKLHGTAERPRLTISKTHKHIYAQLIDDERGVTLGGIGTLSKVNRKEDSFNKKSKESAKEIGKQIGEMAKKQNIAAVVFDRGVYKFHGIIALVASGAREAGLQF